MKIWTFKARPTGGEFPEMVKELGSDEHAWLIINKYLKELNEIGIGWQLDSYENTKNITAQEYLQLYLEKMNIKNSEAVRNNNIESEREIRKIINGVTDAINRITKIEKGDLVVTCFVTENEPNEYFIGSVKNRWKLKTDDIHKKYDVIQVIEVDEWKMFKLDDGNKFLKNYLNTGIHVITPIADKHVDKIKHITNLFESLS
jgi:phenylpyruvate tautomerase PptA (4-oxalocrotonate tautomerase family)